MRIRRGSPPTLAKVNLLEAISLAIDLKMGFGIELSFGMPTLENTEYTVYLAGELFDFKHLAGNALLAEAISIASGGRYSILLPQDLEMESLVSKAIRDADYLALLRCDLAIFQFDGPDLDSGTVAEFMTAKMVDIPAVLLRTDFRRSGDRNTRPWNLMCDSFPRTESVVIDAMKQYSDCNNANPSSAVEAAKDMIRFIADSLVAAMDSVMLSDSVLSDEDAKVARSLVNKSYDLDAGENI